MDDSLYFTIYCLLIIREIIMIIIIINLMLIYFYRHQHKHKPKHTSHRLISYQTTRSNYVPAIISPGWHGTLQYTHMKDDSISGPQSLGRAIISMEIFFLEQPFTLKELGGVVKLVRWPRSWKERVVSMRKSLFAASFFYRGKHCHRKKWSISEGI